MSDSVTLLTNKEINKLVKGKTIDRIGDNGENSQIIHFTDGTQINIFNDWFNGEGLKYQLIESEVKNK